MKGAQIAHLAKVQGLPIQVNNFIKSNKLAKRTFRAASLCVTDAVFASVEMLTQEGVRAYPSCLLSPSPVTSGPSLRIYTAKNTD